MGGDDDAIDTPDVDPATLPGYAIGFRDGYRLGIARTLDSFRRALIADGTLPTEALTLEGKLAAWMKQHGG